MKATVRRISCYRVGPEPLYKKEFVPDSDVERRFFTMNDVHNGTPVSRPTRPVRPRQLFSAVEEFPGNSVI